MKSSKLVLILGLTLAVIIAAFWILSPRPAANYDAFAKCLTDSGVKMYGAYWCPHCQNQKNEFGTSWQYVNYIECSLPNRAGQTQVCKDAGITGYPTWEFKDGTRLEGEVSFQQLSQKSGCIMP